MTSDRDRVERSRTAVPVLIVGAGPTGLVLALWLTRLGVPVRIIDKTAEPGTTSRALAVPARTLELYRQLGMADAARRRRRQGSGGQLLGSRAHRSHGCPWIVMGEGLTPFPFALIFPQDAHERVLIERLEALGVKVERRTELVRFEQRARRRACDAAAGRRLARRSARRPISRAATGRIRPSGRRWRSASPAGPMPPSSTSPTWRRPARRRTARSMSISAGPTSWRSFP